MYKATLRNKVTGRKFAHVTAAQERNLARYASDEVEVLEGELPLDPDPAQAMLEVRAKRDMLLARHSWTVENHSPLKGQNRQAWLAYLKALHQVTKGNPSPEAVVWPTPPAGFEYE